MFSNKILLVDDSVTFREEFKDALEGYEVIEASSGREALDILKKPNEISLIVLDIKMPGRAGTDVLKDIKKIAPEVKVIILTGYGSKDTAIESLRGHADDYIEKTQDIEKTIDIINKILMEQIAYDGQPGDLRIKMEKVKQFIERNCNKKVSLDDAARVVFLSPKYLSRAFKEVTGTGFNEYRISVKLEKSKELLLNTSHGVCQVAYKLGFENAESFMRLFKKNTGLTPSEFRSNKKRRKRRKRKKSIK